MCDVGRATAQAEALPSSRDVPIDAPRWVIYVGVGDSQKEGTGGTIAAPVFARVAKRVLSP